MKKILLVSLCLSKGPFHYYFDLKVHVADAYDLKMKEFTQKHGLQNQRYRGQNRSDDKTKGKIPQVK